MVKESTQIIQAFPVGPHTYIGTLSTFTPLGYSILHAVEDGTITFTFASANGEEPCSKKDLAFSVMAGQDLAIHPLCESISSSGICWVS